MSGPNRVLSALDAGVVVAGVVLGVGIFRSPTVVASNVGGGGVFLALWVVGGAIALVGALCYAELATAYPDAGGEYTLVSRAFGPRVGFFVAWARMTVIQAGSIAILAFVFGDYVSELPGLGGVEPPILAAAVVVGLTAVNVSGIRPGRGTQYALTVTALLAIVVVAAVGLLAPPATSAAPVSGPEPSSGGSASPALALIFVLLAFGGWSEGAYVSGEVKNPKRGVTRALLWGTGGITLLYLVVNLAYLRGLGLEGVAGSDIVAADLAARVMGPAGRWLVTGAIAVASLSSANASVMTGARSNYALGRDWPAFRFMGRWTEERDTPVNALLLQGAILLALVGFGAVERSGFEAMVAYTAPVYWLVLLFMGAAVMVLRRREPEVERPFRVPLYPVTPLVFCATAAFMTYSAVANAGPGALLGLAVVAAGLPFVWRSGAGPDREEMASSDTP